MKKRTFTRILVIGTACLVLGCGKKEESTQEAKEPETKISEEKEVEKEEETEYKTIGEESRDALRILLTNQMGGDIIGLSVKESTAKEASDNLLDEGMRIKEEETLCLYVVEITGLELDDMEEAELHFEDEVGYVTYKSADSGKEVSTKETALALKAQREAQATAEKAKKEEAKKEEERKAAEQAKKEAEAAAAAQAEAQAQTQYEQQYYEEPTYQEPVYEEPVYQEPVYEEPVYQEPVYEQPADSGGQDVSQSGESCLGGQGVLRY